MTVRAAGPFGSFTLAGASPDEPWVFIAGGSGIAPLMAMLRHLMLNPSASVQARLLYSARGLDDIIYHEELGQMAERPEVQVTFTLTRNAPSKWRGYRRRIDRDILTEVGWAPSAMPRVFVCGPTPFVETVATLLVRLGHDPASVRTERFGPTG